MLSAAMRIGLGRREAERIIESGLAAGASQTPQPHFLLNH
jgi:hypothetical protein